jgi:hypothetical protein
MTTPNRSYDRVILPNGMVLKVGTEGNPHSAFDTRNYNFSVTDVRNHSDGATLGFDAIPIDRADQFTIRDQDFVVVPATTLTEEQRAAYLEAARVHA